MGCALHLGCVTFGWVRAARHSTQKVAVSLNSSDPGKVLRSGVSRPLGVALLTTAAVATLSYALPVEWASTGVGMVFLGTVYFLVLRDPNLDPRPFGLALGGLLETTPLQVSKLVRETALAFGWAALVAAVVFPCYWAGYLWWWHPSRPFNWTHLPSSNEVLGQLLTVGLPEEAFYRGYLQSTLAQALPARFTLLGAPFGAAVLLTSAIFAAGHFATEPFAFRLAVFFPSLVFGWLRSKTTGIGAAIVFHASCNLFSLYLAQGYGLIP